MDEKRRFFINKPFGIAYPVCTDVNSVDYLYGLNLNDRLYTSSTMALIRKDVPFSWLNVGEYFLFDHAIPGIAKMFANYGLSSKRKFKYVRNKSDKSLKVERTV